MSLRHTISLIVAEEEAEVERVADVVGGFRMTSPPLFSCLPAPASFLPLFCYRLSSSALRFFLSSLSSTNVSHSLGSSSLPFDGSLLSYRPIDVSQSCGRFHASLSSRPPSTLSL